MTASTATGPKKITRKRTSVMSERLRESDLLTYITVRRLMIRRVDGVPSILGRHHDFNEIGRIGELRLDRRPRWGISGRNPGVPDRIHLGEIGHVGEPDVG